MESILFKHSSMDLAGRRRNNVGGITLGASGDAAVAASPPVKSP